MREGGGWRGRDIQRSRVILHSGLQARAGPSCRRGAAGCAASGGKGPGGEARGQSRGSSASFPPSEGVCWLSGAGLAQPIGLKSRPCRHWCLRPELCGRRGSGGTASRWRLPAKAGGAGGARARALEPVGHFLWESRCSPEPRSYGSQWASGGHGSRGLRPFTRRLAGDRPLPSRSTCQLPFV